MRNVFQRLGAVAQGMLLGLLLAHSILMLALLSSGVRLFRYQGF